MSSSNSQKSLVQRKDNNYCVQRPSLLYKVVRSMVGTEDCLYLDITEQSKNKSDLLPVMF